VYSVDTEDEAKALLIMTCSRNLDGKLFARELAAEQTLENLQLFSAKLDRAHEIMKKNGRCSCLKKAV